MARKDSFVSGARGQSRWEHVISPRCHERFLVRPGMAGDTFPDLPMDFAGMSELRPAYRVRRWNSEHHLLLLTLGGEGRLQLGRSVQRLRPGTVCVLPCGSTHEYTTPRHWKIVWFHPKPTPAWNHLIGSDPTVRPFLFGNQIAALAETLWTELNSQDPAAREAVRLTAPLLMHYVQRELEQQEDVRQRRWRLRLDALWDAVLASPAHWDVEMLAAKAGCSRTRLHQLCRALYRTSARERLEQLRFRRAAEYLRHSDWTLEQIATFIGYSDAFSFSRAFSRHIGCAPSRFRGQFESPPMRSSRS